MRPVQFADIEVAARVLLAHDSSQHLKIMRELVARADVADDYRRDCGCQHPEFGAGSLMSAATQFPKVKRPPQLAKDQLLALANVLSCLIDTAPHQSA